MAWIVNDHAFLEVSCVRGGPIQRPPCKWDLIKMGDSMLKAFVYRDEEAAANLNEGAHAVLALLWALPLRSQAALMEEANIFAYPSAPDLEGPRALPFGGQRQLLARDWPPVRATEREHCFLSRWLGQQGK